MPHGGRRPGAGRKPKGLAELTLSGGFRLTRHAHLLPGPGAKAGTAAALMPNTEPVPADLLEGLSSAGRSFLLSTWADFELSGVERVLLRQAAKALDDAESAITVRERRLSVRLFAALTAQLTAGLKK